MVCQNLIEKECHGRAWGGVTDKKICLAIAALSLVISAFIHLITLDVEIDASFNKAYPIIKQKVPVEYHQACKSILLAAALTYVIGVFRSFFSLRFIWLLITRMR